MTSLEHGAGTHHTDTHFLHIGKTGGSAVKHALGESSSHYPWLHIHNHATTLANVPVGHRAFFFLRDPITRFVSGFYSRQRHGRPRYNTRWSKAEAIAFSEFTSPRHLAQALSSSNADELRQAEAAMASIQHVRDSYWRWLGSPQELSNRQGDILFIGQQEYLAEDVRVLERHLGIEIGALPTDDVDAHRNPESADRNLDETARANLRRWYEADYQAMDQCAKIARNRGLGGSLAEAGDSRNAST